MQRKQRSARRARRVAESRWELRREQKQGIQSKLKIAEDEDKVYTKIDVGWEFCRLAIFLLMLVK